MGVSSSLYSGVSGLNANGNAMSVIGNNIANANTVGFKSSRAIFGDLLSSQISGSGGISQVGRGVGLSIVDNIFSQGTFENTETNTDLAVEGSGFFIVSDPTTGNSVNDYTRAGAFRFDANGYLVNPEGYNVMGFQLDTNGNTYGDLVPVWANTQSFTAAGPTANITLNTNIDSDSVAIPAGFDINNPAASSHYATSIQVFDSLGSTHLMTTYFTKTANQSWEWNTVVDGGEVTGGTAGTLELVGEGVLNYDASGNLDLTTSGTGNPLATAGVFTTAAGTLDWVNGAVQTQQISIDMQTTQYASPSVVVSQEQDGYGTGTLVKLSIDEVGNIVGNFSNGTPRKLMRLALAKFTNPGALTKAGNNMFSESGNSGPSTIGTVGSGVGNIFTNALELSNVDLAQEFVKMITTQRGFSANSKTITTTDEMLAEVISLKR
ncbi:MAG: flagellar hook protein FlgE [Deltaproteobacteria bacterium]|nr:flagellar hook protein FlgE [Deltaproteobacteria bacterium]